MICDNCEREKNTWMTNFVKRIFYDGRDERILCEKCFREEVKDEHDERKRIAREARESL